MTIPCIEKIVELVIKKYHNSLAVNPFVPLKIEETPTLNSFSIVAKAYEGDLDEKYGIRLEDLKNGEESEFMGDLEKNVSFYKETSHSEEQIDDEILKKYKDTPEFCSMKVESKERLDMHVKNIHELSYNHYVFGKKNNMRSSFPSYCCGHSSQNLFLTLMEKGYPNATFFYNSRHDHAYVGLPFVLGKNKEKGFIIVDPTSDQLFNDKKNAPRNNTFVISGTEWKYETDWANGNDLFPASDDWSEFSNLCMLKNRLKISIPRCSDMEKYFGKVFENVVDVKIKPF